MSIPKSGMLMSTLTHTRKSCSKRTSMLMSIFQDVDTYMGVLTSIPKSRMLMSTLVHTRNSCSKLISIFQDVGTYMGLLMSIDNKHIDNLTAGP
jgi:hypothetical protein